MPKRRAAPSDSESEGEGGVSQPSQPSKRPRTSQGGRASGAVEPQASQTPKRKNKKRREDNGEDDEEDGDGGEDEEMEQTTPDEDEERRFEAEHEEQIREKVMNKAKIQGGIAEMGIIERLEMHQFMCHKYLTFTFGPQINFIIGHNGSGKSAVLTALTVALGGKATTTGRGSGLKSFIKEGQTAAEVSVTIKNQGEEAFKPQEYGNSIVITRRFTKDGQSQYKIKSKDGKVISTKREELSAICDHMNIQVDNPMNILTQDAARQFLSASAPTDKYKFFLRGTQLSQLSEEYSACMANITQTQNILVNKSAAIPDLEEALAEATMRFQEATKAREQRHRADELKKELAWSHVSAKEAEMRAKMEEAEKQNRRLPKVLESITNAQDAIKEAEEEVAKHEEELGALGSIEHLAEKRKEVQERLKQNRTEIASAKADQKSINESMQNVKKQIDRFTKTIEDETKKQMDNTQNKREETNRKLSEAVEQLKEGEKQWGELKGQVSTIISQLEETKKQGKGYQEEREQVRSQIHGCEEQLRGVSEREKNKLAPYGNKMDAVLHDISRTQWRGMKPVGPIGLYVKVKDPQWAALMRIQLGSSMNTFAVTDGGDRSQLNDILKRHGNHKISIVITEKDLFDYSRGEPPEEFMTVLRALEVTDEFVLRILINQARIESTMLAPTRAAGDHMLTEYGRGGTAWTNDLYRVQRYPEGGGSSQTLYHLSANDTRHQLFRGEDTDAQKREITQELQKLAAKHRALDEKVEECQRAFNNLMNKKKDISTRDSTLQRELRDIKAKRDALQDEVNEDMPVAIQALQDELESLERERSSHKQQFADISAKLNQLNEAQHPLMKENDEHKKAMDEYDSRRREVRSRIEQAAGVRIQAQADQQHWLQKQKTEQQKFENLDAQRQQLEEEFQAWTNKARMYCEPFPNPRETEVVQRDLKSVQSALKERENRHGASVEDMTIEVNTRKSQLETARRELKGMMVLNKTLRKSIKVRLRKWHEFRRHIALRCKIYFTFHLSHRGYYGRALFDHVHGTLNLKVTTDDQTTMQSGTREKDPRSLSGGEKSFSTICLLLSLWESIGCPIRCLDEFDVFMDAVNRRTSMKMMIDSANASDRKQYLLITPQDMTNVQIGPSVRVHRMMDPERGQATLSM